MTTGEMWGADIQAMEQLSRDLDAAAERLATIQNRLRARIHASPWRGRRAERFIGDWDGVHRARLSAAQQALRTAAETVRRNASDQRTASAAPSGSSSGGSGAPGPSFWSGVWGASVIGAKVGRAAFDVLEGVRKRGYTPLWRELQKAFPRITHQGDFFRFRKSPVVKWLEKRVRHPSPGADALDFLKKSKILPVLDLVSMADSVGGVQDAYRDGDGVKVATESMDLVGGALRNTKSPAAYLIGVNLSLWGNVIDEGRQLDLSAEGWRQIAEASPSDWADSFKSALGKTGKAIFGSLF